MRLCGGLQRINFEQFLYWGDCGGLEGTDFNSIQGIVVLKELILTVDTLGGCDGLERTHFQHFLHWEAVMVLKELIFNSFYIGRLW